MGLFSRKTPSEPRTPAREEIAAAGRALARGNQRPADRLVAEAGADGQHVAMRILADSIDFTPQD
ncbi:hypothetical protein [Streptomyces laurentii]|uniref:hypothetical protein n=1 Tax=Streptomyces laurentii TaxID=39478 RepID=UPI0033E8926A